MIINQKLATRHRGFTLIETFVGITVLTIAVIGPLSLLAKAIADGNFAKNQVTAFYLAQEAAELVISKRNDNLLNGQDWLSDLRGDCVGSNNYCKIWIDNANSIITSSCSVGDDDCSQLFQNEFSLYTHSDGVSNSPTPFFRILNISDNTTPSGGKGATINVKVKWRGPGNLSKTVEIASFITDTSIIPTSE